GSVTSGDLMHSQSSRSRDTLAHPRDACATQINLLQRSRFSSLPRASSQTRDNVFAIKFGDETGADFRRTHCFAFVSVRAIAETFCVHLPHHFCYPRCAFRRALRQKGELRNFCRGEKHGRSVRASRGASSATDARGGSHRQIRFKFWDWNGIRFRRGTGARRDETTSLHDAIKRATIDYQIAHQRKWFCSKWLDRNRLAIIEGPHVKLARGRGMLRTMRLSVNR